MNVVSKSSILSTFLCVIKLSSHSEKIKVKLLTSIGFNAT